MRISITCPLILPLAAAMPFCELKRLKNSIDSGMNTSETTVIVINAPMPNSLSNGASRKLKSWLQKPFSASIGKDGGGLGRNVEAKKSGGA